MNELLSNQRQFWSWIPDDGIFLKGRIQRSFGNSYLKIVGVHKICMIASGSGQPLS